MRVRVKLFGTLGNRVADYDHQLGMCIDLPEQATVQELVAALELSDAKIGLVSMDGRKVALNQQLQNDADICIFQSIMGG